MATLPLAAAAAPAQAPAANAPLALRATPMLSEKLPPRSEHPITFLMGDQMSGRSGLDAKVIGDAELRQPGLSVHAHEITYDQMTDVVQISGGVRINSAGNQYTGTQGQLQVDAFSGFLLHPTYRFLATGGHGEGKKLTFIDRDRASIADGTYTTCVRPGPDWVPDWILRAAKLDVDQEEDEGHATDAVLDFKGVPILAVPSITFGLSDKRRTGWLPPTLALDSQSGISVTTPYYWDIAPNRDATITPTVMSRRGVNTEGEFRYLESNYNGKITADFMPDDRLRNANRWALFTQHSGTYDSGLSAIGKFGLNLNINHASDDNYYSDFLATGSGFNQLLTTRTLLTNGALTWGRGNFSASIGAQKWQTLQDPTAPITPPYDRLPQLTAHWGRINDGGFDYAVNGDFSRFHNSFFYTQQPNADRSVLNAQISRPFVAPWGFLTPAAKVHASDYRFFDGTLADGATTANRLIPTVSLDSGLVFERNASYFGRAFTQTLEPRLKYIYTPYRDQSLIPNYDSGAYDFNFATIWADNAFAGDDRVVDNNLVTAGVTSRLLDPETGAEALRLDFAQRYRFSPQQVTLPGTSPEARGWSDIMLGAGIHWTPKWSMDTVVQYNLDTRQSTRSSVSTRYQPSAFHVLNLTYRNDRILNTKSVGVGWQWPLGDIFGGGSHSELGTTRTGGGSCSGRWYSIGRLDYDLIGKTVSNLIAGFEYDTGCWIGRIVLEKLQNGLGTSTSRIMFQLEFKGLTSVGTSPLSTLRDNIRGYETLPRLATPPSRFTNYE